MSGRRYPPLTPDEVRDILISQSGFTREEFYSATKRTEKKIL
jgi:hypothetical protein